MKSNSFTAILIFSSLSCVLTRVSFANLDIVFPAEWKGDIEKNNKYKLKEPSGIAYDQKNDVLYAIGDEGDICKIKPDGTLLAKGFLDDRSFEGLTQNPNTGMLYAVIEGEDNIVEIDPSILKITREFNVPRKFKGKTILKSGGRGLEAIAFVPSHTSKNGGTFFLGNQSFKLKNPKDESALIEVELFFDRKGGKKNVIILNHFRMPFIDVSGIDFDSEQRVLKVISDDTNTIHDVSLKGKVLRSTALPGNDQEGIAFDALGNVFIAQDSGGILRYDK